MRARRKHSREFKVETVKLVRERGVPMAQAARDLDLSVTLVRKWVRQFAADPKDAFPGLGQQKPADAELTQLRREVARLKMERDILKKAAADSTGRCNTLGKYSGRRAKTEGLPRPRVELFRNAVEIALRVGR